VKTCEPPDLSPILGCALIQLLLAGSERIKMYTDATNSRSLGASKTSIFFLALTSLIAGYVVVFSGGPIAQSHGDLRLHGLTGILLAGLLGILYCLTVKPAPRLNSAIERLVLLLPAYALLQVTPLPLRLVRILSPARARVAHALSQVMPAPDWVTLSVAPSATFYHFLVFAACAILFLIILDLSSRFSVGPWMVLFPLTFMATAEAILGLIQVAGHPDAVATGTYLIRNHYAGFLEMILPFVALYPFAVLGRREPGPHNEVAPALLVCVGLGLSALIIAAILSSLSRMGFVASLLSMMFVTIAAAGLGRTRRRLLLIFAGAGILALLAFILVPSPKLVMRFADMVQTDEDRSPVWRETFGLIAAYPVFGCGLGGYESAFLEFKKSNPELNQDYAHNDYLQYLAELGIAGFLVAVIPLSRILVRLCAACRQNRADLRWLSLACVGSVAAISIHSLVDFNLYVPANLFTFAWILGVAANVGRSASRHESMAIEPAAILWAPPTTARAKSYR
jgi:O-antigen ligase